MNIRLSPLLLLLLLHPAWAAVDVQIRPAVALPGEVFEVQITQSPARGDEPDLGVLPAGLAELGRSTSRSHQIINGQHHSSKTWNISVLAMEPGEYLIQPQPLGGEPIRPQTVRVRALDPQAQQSAEVFVEFEADTQRTWVGAQVVLTLKAYVAGELDSGALPDPEADGLVVERIAENNSGEAIVGNTRYRVIERRYVAFAEEPGVVTSPGPLFRAQIVDRSRRDRFSVFGPATRTVQRAAAPINLEFLPAEPRPDAAWLPASRVVIQDRLDGDTAQQHQALTRDIQILVDGQLHTQLPSLNWPQPPSQQAQSYEEPLSSESMAVASGVRASLQQRFVHIPQTTTLELPGLSLPWFNTNTGEWEEATLPPRKLTVQAAATQVEPATPEPTANASPTTATVPKTITVRDAGYWPLASALLGTAWLATLFGWMWTLSRRRADAQQDNAQTIDRQTDRPSTRALIKALPNYSAPETARALLAWWPGPGQPTGLLAMAQLCEDHALSTALRQLNTHLYGGGDWASESLIEALRNWRAPGQQAHEKTAALKALYPD